MPTYSVTLFGTVYLTLEVEADDVESAEAIALGRVEDEGVDGRELDWVADGIEGDDDGD